MMNQKREEQNSCHFCFWCSSVSFISVYLPCSFLLKLAISPATAALEDEECSSIRVVLALYEALSSGDVETVQKLLAPDLEWWFHGPPSHQHLMRLLTGTASSSDNNFVFSPSSIKAIGSTVLVEGCDQNCSVSWVHAWTVSDDGVITQVREYFNTSLTVTRIEASSQTTSSSSSSSASAPASFRCQSLWQSTLPNSIGKSVPGLVLAI